MKSAKTKNIKMRRHDKCARHSSVTSSQNCAHFIYTMYKIIAIGVVRFVSVLRMPELNPHRLSSLPVHAKTRTTRLVYVPSSLGSVRIGSKVTTLPPTLLKKAAGQDRWLVTRWCRYTTTDVYLQTFRHSIRNQFTLGLKSPKHNTLS